MIDWNLAGPAAVIGAVAASVGVFLLELMLKPAFARRRVATILLAEMRLNARGLKSIAAHGASMPVAVPEDIVMSTLGWDAVKAEVHYLPAELLDSLLLRYNQFREVNDLVARYSRKVDRAYDLPTPLENPSSNEMIRVNALQSELAHDAKVFTNIIPKLLEGCESTVRKLQRVLDEGPP